MAKCISCDKDLTANDIGFHKKMVNRGATEYECIDCLCNYFGMTTERAFELIERFKKNGCTLFV